jgi:hypothetical protein
VEVDPETAELSIIATLAGILPTRLAVGPDGTFFAVQREDKDEFMIYKSTASLLLYRKFRYPSLILNWVSSLKWMPPVTGRSC